MSSPSPTTPPKETVLKVTKACSCSPRRATELLKWSENNPEKAIKHFHVLEGYRKAKPSKVSAKKPIQPPKESGKKSQKEGILGSLPQLKSSDFGIKFSRGPETTYGNFLSGSSSGPCEDGQGEEDEDEPGYLSAGSEPDWDLNIPILLPPNPLTPNYYGSQDEFDLNNTIALFQQGKAEQDLQNYIGYYNNHVIRSKINCNIADIPAMFYVVAQNEEWLLRVWVSHGGDVNAIHEKSGLPLLAYAIMCSEIFKTDTTRIVATLLGLGASPHVIPSCFYTPFCRDAQDIPADEPNRRDMDEKTEWCTTSMRSRLTRTSNLTQRYHLERASKIKRDSKRHKQVANRKNVTALLGLPYFLIGQTLASDILLTKMLAHLMNPPSDKPSVLVFAGPSGHGKTELARQMGHLLGLELEVVDCTIVRRETDLYGPRRPYQGHEKGSPLNNFLARNDDCRCIVFLDEFEKTTIEIREALLLPFDNGEYQDRRHLTKINCLKTIWIIATNACDTTIKTFCNQNHDALFSDEKKETQEVELMKKLSRQLRENFLGQFGAPLTGRVSSFIPFLQFSPKEAAVVAHKYLLELAKQVARPIILSDTPENDRMLGNVRLKIRRDATVCKLLAQDYHVDLGARSLRTAVKGTVEELLVDEYLEVDEEIQETEEFLEFWVDERGGEVVGGIVKEKENTGAGDME